MSTKTISSEIQVYIAKIMEQRRTKGIFDFADCQKLLEYAAETNSDAVFGIGYYYFSEHYWMQGESAEAMHCLMESAKYFQSAQMYEFLTRTYNMMGAVSDSQDNPVVALNYYYTGLQYGEKYGVDYALAMIQSNIATILLRMKRYQEAQERFRKSIALYEKSQETYHRNYNLMNTVIKSGCCYLKTGEKEQAENCLKKAGQLLKSSQECSTLDLRLKALEGLCCLSAEDKKGFEECVTEIVTALEGNRTLDDIEICLVDLVEALEEAKEDVLLDSLLQQLDEKGLDRETVLSMDVYPYRSKYLLRQNRRQEYLQHTRKFFASYEQDRKNSIRITERVMELRDKLQAIEEEREKMKLSNQHLESIALYDAMTNLANRNYIHEHFSNKFEDAQNGKKLLGVELLDIDYFKQYNDTYGHLQGDTCIEAVAGILKGLQNDKVFCGRFGGDEFMVIYSDMTVEEIRQTAERLQTEVQQLKLPGKAEDGRQKITVSQGIYVAVPQTDSKEWDFNTKADMTLYEAKKQGRNCVRIMQQETDRHEEVMQKRGKRC